MAKAKTVNEEVTAKMEEKDVPVVLEIKAGYATLGKYSLAYEKPDGYVQFGNGDLADDISDLWVIPLKPTELVDRCVYIIGNYSPASPAESSQISVTYIFRQRKELKPRVQIERMVTGVACCNHTIYFEL